MSPAPNPSVRLEPDAVAARTLLVIYVVALAVTIAGIVWAGLALDSFTSARLPAGAPEVLAPTARPAREIAMIEQTLITADPYPQRLTLTKRQWLESFGWVDREQGLAHIPIEDAMRIVVERRR